MTPKNIFEELQEEEKEKRNYIPQIWGSIGHQIYLRYTEIKKENENYAPQIWGSKGHKRQEYIWGITRRKKEKENYVPQIWGSIGHDIYLRNDRNKEEEKKRNYVPQIWGSKGHKKQEYIWGITRRRKEKRNYIPQIWESIGQKIYLRYTDIKKKRRITYHKYEEVKDTKGELDIRLRDQHLLHNALWLQIQPLYEETWIS